jgi:hypothetical protein
MIGNQARKRVRLCSMSEILAAAAGSKERSMSWICSKFMVRALLFSTKEISALEAALLPNEATASSKLGVLLSATTTMVLKKVLSPSV